MKDNERDIILTLSSLYEILLQIGQSFDIKENAEYFLKTLMLQQNLSFAGYYKLVESETILNVYSIPKTKIQLAVIPGKVQQSLERGSIRILRKQDLGFEELCNLNELEQHEVAVSIAGTKSFLVMSKKFESFDIHELAKYELVINKFCLFMESLESHHQIKDEIRIKNEQALTIQTKSQELIEQNEQLRKYISSNTELEKFAYRTSHDLKAPLRSIVSFSKMLQKNSDANLTEDQLEYLNYIIKGGDQMNGLIDGILEYSKINALALKKSEIDLADLLDELALLLHENIASIDAKILRKNLPQTIIADRTKLKQLFLNLLNNALKFHRIGIAPEITISSEESEKVYQFSVADNGIGMKEENTTRIFEVFEMLNSANHYTGSGIGLSTCKQIVLQHGGRIWVDSELGKGSTFHFTIGKE